MTNTPSNSSADTNEHCVRSASHQYFTTALGGLVTNAVKMQEVSVVLDIGCNEGGWVLDLARKYPRLHITGIDTDEHALSAATRFARFHGISNATFLAMDAISLHTFKDNTLDLVHMSATQFLYDSRFNSILAECTRVLRPGGWLHLIEFEPGASSSLALNRLLHLFIHTIRTIRKKTPDETPTIGTAAHLYDILLNAYFLDVSYTVHAVDFNPNNILGAKAFLDEALLAMHNLKSLVCRLNAISVADYEALLAQAYEDMKQPDVCGYGYLISVVGCKNG